jgi:hypothetical protein
MTIAAPKTESGRLDFVVENGGRDLVCDVLSLQLAGVVVWNLTQQLLPPGFL